MDTLETLYKRHQYDRNIATKSMQWFKREMQTMEMYAINSDKVLREGGTQTTSIEPGSMYFYYYSPKHKDTLEYYDTFPMVIPYDTTSNGFIGLNLHYLPVFARVKLLDVLMKFATNTRMDKTTKIQYSWQAVKGMSKFKWAEPCIHRYIGGYVKSRFVKIDPENWFHACMLPVQRFKKASAETVWKDSLS